MVCRARERALRRLPGRRVLRVARGGRRGAARDGPATGRRASASRTPTAGSAAGSSRRWRRATELPDGIELRAAWSGRSRGWCATDWCGVGPRGSAFRNRPREGSAHGGSDRQVDPLGFAPWPWIVKASRSATSPSAGEATSPKRSTRILRASRRRSRSCGAGRWRSASGVASRAPRRSRRPPPSRSGRSSRLPRPARRRSSAAPRTRRADPRGSRDRRAQTRDEAVAQSQEQVGNVRTLSRRRCCSASTRWSPSWRGWSRACAPVPTA